MACRSGRKRVRKNDPAPCSIGLLQPRSGHILYQGQDITQLGEEALNNIRKKMGIAVSGSSLV